ncbi:MAG: ornithine carbamoyltransferase, partial [Candidatus Bathyarchaeia archaeon]
NRFGKENELALHEKYKDWKLTKELADLMDRRGIIMHVLPVFRGEEATDEAMDSPNSAIYDQAENRLFTQMAVLSLIMGGK